MMNLRDMVIAATVLGAAGCSGGGEDDGQQAGEQLRDMEFSAFLDGETDEPVSLRLSDYFAENRAGTRILVINAAAGWCAPCMREADALAAFASTYEPRGVAVLTAIFQDQNGEAADDDFVRAWVDTFDLSVPALIDSSFQLGEYVDAKVMPANVFADAESLDILQVAHGAGTGDDPMLEYRELLDFYLDE